MNVSHDSDVNLGLTELTKNIRGSSLRLASQSTLHSSPRVGDEYEGCLLVAELGRGASGHVFLAQQTTLSDRPLVLKVTNLTHDEHLNLARLQHTHIMPLYWAAITLGRPWRILAMPYLARATLSRLLRRLEDVPIEQRSGARTFEALQADEDDLPIRLPVQEHGPLQKQSWVEYITRVGFALAEALAFAHERRMLHLDIKPSNILITPDGVPMLLDLDVARPPIAAGTPSVSMLGGTERYASPEQRAAMKALEKGTPIPYAIDGRSDQYSLGLVLFECLGGTLSPATPDLASLRSVIPPEAAGLIDILTRSLQTDPAARYRDCQALAEDLNRQLQNLPLQGVRNRWRDRWRKWQRRHPHGLAFSIVLLGFILTAGAAGFHYQDRLDDRRQQTEAALLEGQDWARKGEYGAAIRRFQEGLDLAEELPGAGVIRGELQQRMTTAQRLQKAGELRQTVHLLRFHALQESTPRRMKYVLEAAGRKLWASRQLLLQSPPAPLERTAEKTVRDQFLEMVVLWTELQVQVAPASHRELVREEAAAVLRETEAMLGTSFALTRAQQQLGIATTSPTGLEPKSAWESSMLGRWALAENRLDEMDRHWQQALDLDPAGFATNFYHGIGSLHQKRYEQAARAFSYTLGQNDCAECYLYRGLALAALGEDRSAMRDFDLAIEKNPELAEVYRQRSGLLEKVGRLDEARRDRERASALSE